MDFTIFSEAVNEQFSLMAEDELFVTDVTKDELWDTYLNSFPEGTNQIFRERREFDCQCCKTFIRGGGNVVSIDNDFNLVSIWDIKIGGHYQVVADALSDLVKSRIITGIFRYFQKNLGTDYNHEMIQADFVREIKESTRRWNHFHFKLPKRFVHTGIGNPHVKSKEEKELLQRGLEDISIEALDTVWELIEQGSIYRGEEQKPTLEKFRHLYQEKEHIVGLEVIYEIWLWVVSSSIGRAGRIRNTAIGTLLIDISEDMELDQAVYRFNNKMDPVNYKRPTSVVTKGMIEKAQKKIEELGYMDSLPRRHAVIDDVTINNVLFANRDAKKAMNVFDELIAETPVDIKNLEKVEEVSVNTFIDDILPTVNNVELYFENKHQNNLMSLISPVNPDAKNMLKWGNNFSWAYNGEVADSMRALVRKAGGKVDGVLRFSIKWNDGDNNPNDFDAHSLEPVKRSRRNVIDFNSAKRVHDSSGMLDVDIIHPGSKPAVENIIYTDLNKMPVGEYDFLVHNYSHDGCMTGFTAEIEFEGEIHTFVYEKNLRRKEKVKVATVLLDKNGKFKITKSLKSTTASKNVWGINSCQFQKVSMIMNSPNHWDGEKTGNRHLFFILDECKTEENVRGFFNEFLDENLTEHRKVFEVLGSKMKAEKSDNQLSGLGFSSTQRNQIICKVTGSFSRIIKINF